MSNDLTLTLGLSDQQVTDGLRRTEDALNKSTKAIGDQVRGKLGASFTSIGTALGALQAEQRTVTDELLDRAGRLVVANDQVADALKRVSEAGKGVGSISGAYAAVEAEARAVGQRIEAEAAERQARIPRGDGPQFGFIEQARAQERAQVEAGRKARQTGLREATRARRQEIEAEAKLRATAEIEALNAARQKAEGDSAGASRAEVMRRYRDKAQEYAGKFEGPELARVLAASRAAQDAELQAIERAQAKSRLATLDRAAGGARRFPAGVRFVPGAVSQGRG